MTAYVTVWDPFIRIAHWAVVVAFVIAYVSEDALSVHVWAGYVVGAVVLLRIVWGFIGPKHARFSDFLYGPGTMLAYVLDLLRFNAKRYLGHSPAGAAMVFALILSLAATVLTGMAVYGARDNAGPLAGFYASTTVRVAEETGTSGKEDEAGAGGERREGGTLKEVHEFLASLTLWLAVLHIAGVLWASLVHRENLVRAMITGEKRAQ